MASGIGSKIKVAWICHFSNTEIREKIPLSNKKKYTDFAPWITNMIKEFEKREEVEIHIIAPHRGLKTFLFEYTQNNIYYHFFKPDLPVIHKRWPFYFPIDAWTGYLKNRLIVHHILKRIRPDLINLHGAENDYYSATALGIKNIPVFISIQGIYSNPKRFNDITKPNKHRIKIERTLHKQCKYFGIFPPFFADLIKRDNANPILFLKNYPFNLETTEIRIVEKKYDFVFFGRVADVKGIDKIIEAIAFIKSTGRETTLLVIGAGQKVYIEYLQGLIKKYNLVKNITFVGHLPTIHDVHKKALEAKVTVISSRFDVISGTIIESILMSQPVVATAVGGVPYLNKNSETILLSEYGDIEGLAGNMLKLLDNPEYAEELTEKCKRFIISEFDSNTIVTRFIKQYYAIIEHYKYNTPIPTDLLFNEKYFNKIK